MTTTIAKQDSDELPALAEAWDEHAETTIDEGLALTARDGDSRLAVRWHGPSTGGFLRNP